MADDIIQLIPRPQQVDDDEENNTTSPMDVSYDISLPAQHTYLGDDMEDLTGRTVFEEDSIHTVPVLTSHDVILVPGQILPLQIFRPLEISMMRRIIEEDRTFGIIADGITARANQNRKPVLGTTAEVRSYKEETDDLSGVSTLVVKAEGRQRFNLLSSRRRTDGILTAEIKILPDDPTPDVGEVARLQCLNRFQRPSEINMSRNLGRYGFAPLTRWPAWVYLQYDAEVLVNRIKSELSEWTENFSTLRFPEDPGKFSYWVAGSLLLDDEVRLEMLSYDSPIQRLRCELAILRECVVLTCKECRSKVADRGDVFSMSQQGPQGTYVNPHGYVHEMITVRRAKGVYWNGRPSSEYSWFPGYAWTILHCRSCHCHVGWKFTAVEKNLLPLKFWGLCRSAIKPSRLPVSRGQQTSGRD
ncbi:protein cereblon-like [Ornithodoros turicata]|uniref:Protein cereblon n=1 Tax=Ornithodoros turicata TaxID=34597 RepID=A0A2R5L7E3_9ACAR